MKTIRIASGAGYAGDRIEPALDIIKRGQVDYIMFECLAERTIALAQGEKLEHPDKGYNPLLDYRMEKVIPLLKEHPVKIVTNMGAANPFAAAKRMLEIAEEHGLADLRIAAVTGDDVREHLDQWMNESIMETGEKLKRIADKVISANAYIGGAGITQAFSEGADIVVTGRAADPALASGPLMYEFQKEYNDYGFLGKTIAAGHLLECGGQVTGGYYADPGRKDVPKLWNLGFPIITFDEEGGIVLEKLPGTGGLLNEHTVKEQLLYEVQDPENYLTPDVIADFSKIRVRMLKEDRVAVTGASGKKRSGTLKVSVGYEDGFIGTGEFSYGGRNCEQRARLAIDILKHRVQCFPFTPREARYDLLGVNSLYQSALTAPAELLEVRLRAAIRTETEAEAQEICRETEALYTNGPAGGGGARGTVTRVVSVASILIPESVVAQTLIWQGGAPK